MTSGEGSSSVQPVEEERIFLCAACGLEEKYDYFGSAPKYTAPIEFKGEVYCMRDPFVAPDKSVSTQYLVLGAHCALCRQSVCADPDSCSLFYEKRLCVDCLRRHYATLPPDLQKEVKRMKKPDEEEKKS